MWLSKHFSVKDLGEKSYILGIKIYKDRSKMILGLSQGIYIDSMLKKFSMKDSKKRLMYMGSGIHLSKKQVPKTPEERDRISKTSYASPIGSILYGMICT